MDSYNQSSSFLNLLTSQQPNSQSPYQYDPRSPSTQLGSSNLSAFATQWSEDPNHDEHTVEDRKERRKWSPTEDVVLISAWLNTSKDPVVANEQKLAAFWKRIAAYFSASPKVAGMQKREPNHCKQRWCKINEGVCKFVGCYEAATRQKSSGQNENDVMKVAHEIFFNDFKVKFTLEHAWRELRHDQKWCGSSSNKRKCDDQYAQSSTVVPGELGEDGAMARPAGVKAAKAKRSASKSSTVEGGKALLEFQSMWEIKQKDLAVKEKLSKEKLVDSLLAKTEPLTEMEMALKEKLINNMLA